MFGEYLLVFHDIEAVFIFYCVGVFRHEVVAPAFPEGYFFFVEAFAAAEAAFARHVLAHALKADFEALFVFGVVFVEVEFAHGSAVDPVEIETVGTGSVAGLEIGVEVDFRGHFFVEAAGEIGKFFSSGCYAEAFLSFCGQFVYFVFEARCHHFEQGCHDGASGSDVAHFARFALEGVCRAAVIGAVDKLGEARQWLRDSRCEASRTLRCPGKRDCPLCSGVRRRPYSRGKRAGA